MRSIVYNVDNNVDNQGAKMKLVKDGNVWKVDFTRRGKRHRLSTGCRDKRAAEAFLRQLQTAASAPTYARAVEILRAIYGEAAEARPAGLPISAAWDEYCRLATATGRTVAPLTLRRRGKIYERLTRWLRAKRPTVETVDGVTGPVAAAFAADLAGEGLRTKTRANILGELAAVWTMLARSEEGLANPWHKLAPRDTDGRRGLAFTPAEEERVLAAAKAVGKQWWAICMVMRGTGLRYGDVARLMRREVVDGVIRLAPHKTRRHGIAVAIPLTDEVAAALASVPDTGDWYFPAHAERYAKRSAGGNNALSFRPVLRAAGLDKPGYSVHSWRHTAATRLAAAGVDIETRKRILGHTEDATARRYDHDEHLAETRAALERAAHNDNKGEKK